MTYYKLRIAKIIRETSKAISVQFHVPDELKSTFAFQAGQYVSLQLTLDGHTVRRAYSISSTPNSGILQITIKEIANGYFSKFANQNLQEGHFLEVAPPEGRFLIDAVSGKKYLGIASGSGITPIWSMVSSVLEKEDGTSFYLLYGNKSKADTIFYDALVQLQQQYPNRFYPQLVFSQESADGAMFGRIDAAKIHFLMKNTWKDIAFEQVFLCGPEEMIACAEKTLLEYDLTENQIKKELFSSSINTLAPENVAGTTKLTIVLDDVTTELELSAKQTVLEAALKLGLDAPYSCQGGICSSCMGRVKEGTAVMVKNTVLTDAEVAEGLILTCQAHATSATLLVDYDDI